MKRKLAIITTHPIQYNAPLFKLLTLRSKVEVRVFYTFSQSQKGGQYDAGFGKIIEWDIPLLDGYNYTFIENVSNKPGTYHFNGIINPTLNDSIKEWKPDAIIVYGWSFKSHLQCLRKFHNKIPILFRGDSNLIDDSNTFKRILRTMFLKWVYTHVNYALYVGTANRSYYLQNGLKERQLIFAPHAIDNERFSNGGELIDQKAGRRRIEMMIDEKEIVFLFAGKLEPKKNPKLLINAFKKLNKKAHLIIVGNGVLENSLKENKGKNIHFINFKNQSEMPIIYRMGNVFVLPSKGPGETWGLAVNEAMACSRPVIVSDKCGCAIDLVENGRNGYIFKSNDEADLLDKMNLMMDKKKLDAMGKRSQEIIQNWSINKVCSQIENIVTSE